MEQRLAALFASVGNSLDAATYSYSDSDYLVRKALVKFLDEENALVASVRQTPDNTEVVDSILNYIISTEFNTEDPATWYRRAMGIVVEFADLAHRNEGSEEASRFAALLPEGHPRVARVLSLTASAHRTSFAEWIAADPRLSEEASVIVYDVYSSDPQDSEDLDFRFNYLKMGALVASGDIPEDLYPVIAAFNLTFLQRSAISKALEPFRTRDRKGRFANEFGPIKAWFSKVKDNVASFFSAAGRNVGPTGKPNISDVEYSGVDGIPDGIYEQDVSKSENIEAILPDSAIKGLNRKVETVSNADQKDAVDLDQFLATRKDAPTGWTKLAGEGGRSRDAWKSPDGEVTATKAAGESKYTVEKLDGSAKEEFNSWGGVQEYYIGTGGKLPDRTDARPSFLDALAKEPQVGLTPEEILNGEEDKGFESNWNNWIEETQGPPQRDGSDPAGKARNAARRSKQRILEEALGRPLTKDEMSTLDLDPEDTSYSRDFNRPGMRIVDSRDLFEGQDSAKAKLKEELKKQRGNAAKPASEPDLNQDASEPTKELTPDLIGEGYGFSKESENDWVQEGVGPNGESYSVSRGSDGKWTVSERSGAGPDNFEDRDLENFDNAKEAFEFANDQGQSPNEFDQDWVDELMSDEGADLNQGLAAPMSPIDFVLKDKVDESKLSPANRKKYAKQISDINAAIFSNNRKKINDLLSRAALDRDMPDDVYSALAGARDAHDTRKWQVENMLAGGSAEELEEMINDPEFAGWRDRLQDAFDYQTEIDEINLDQDVSVLSEKQSEAASGKQYAFLDEFLAERQLDPATEQAFRDALENKNLNKAQASALIGIGRAADFKPEVDSSKPSERMLNSLQGYLATKDLAPSEIKEALDSLQKDGSRDNVDALLNKLRRKKDKPVDLNQGASSLTKYADGSYEWEDVYNNINVNKGPNGWEVEYTSPDLDDRGGQTWSSRRFNSEDEALAFAEEILKENQEDSGFARAADILTSTPDLDQDAKGTLADPATDRQFDFLQSLVDSKKITDPALEQAVRSAIEEKNLTKGEAGAFIGQLRGMEDRPNARREPSAKQIASIRRALQERDVTPEEFNDIRDKIGRGLDSEVSISFDEASEILNDLKSRPITNIENLLGVMEDDEDLDGLRYILDKPEYAEFRDQILESIENLLEEMGIEPDLDQDTSSGKPTQQEVSSLLDSLALEQDMDGLKALLDNPNYSEFRDDIRDTIQTLRRDQGTDQDFDPDIDQDVDLDQDATPGDTAKNSKLGTVLFPHKTAQVLESILDEKLKRLRAEGASPEQIEKLSKLTSQMRSIRLRDRKWGEVSPPDFINFTPDEAREALSALEEYLAENPDSELAGLGGRSLQKSGESFEDYNNRNKNIKENALPDLKEKLESLANGSLPTPKKRPPTDKQIASIRRGALERGLSEEEAAAILDRVDDLSFDDASKIISDLKARPITDGGIDNLVNNSELDVLESIVDRPDYAPWKDKIQSKIDEINSSPDLDQDVSRSVSRDDLANKLAEDIDAEDIFLVDGDTIKEALKFFDEAKFTFSAGDMVKEIYEMANDLDNRDQPELAKRARELADRMFDEMLERFGFGDAGRYENGFDPVDLDDAQDAITEEREMFFETDVDVLVQKLEDTDRYGDNRAGGAEARIIENEDGTYEATVGYDRDSESQTFEDRDEAIAWAANKVSDYNSDVIPSSYQEGADLSKEAAEAKTPEQAAAFADKLDDIADDLDGNRGDRGLARRLRESAQNIRDAVARREAQNLAGVPDEPTTPETMDEMATDPDLNPAGYAESVSDDLYKQFEAGQKMDPTSRMVSDKPEPGEYKSADGRVVVTVEADGDMDDGEMVDASYYSVKIDGVDVGTKGLNWSDEVAADIQQLVEEYFSKKA